MHFVKVILFQSCDQKIPNGVADSSLKQAELSCAKLSQHSQLLYKRAQREERRGPDNADREDFNAIAILDSGNQKNVTRRRWMERYMDEGEGTATKAPEPLGDGRRIAVSYTHLTLPPILLV